MTKLNYNEIEKKWQKYWNEKETNKTNNNFQNKKGKFYILDMFPYPSGEGLHVGHPKGYIATDVYSRLKKMQGYNVLHPMGWDAFGLPAEQFAIKNKINPNLATAKNVARYKEQIDMLGINYDWDREINTTDPKFYKWTQWMWKQMYKDGLSYESFDPINWCPSCKTGLANEDLDGNACERCGTIVEKKKMRQWTIRITDYADRLLNDLDKLNWEPHIKELQRNWIGKSVGSEIDFNIVDAEKKNLKENKLKIFTTRADTLFGCTFMAISFTLAKEWIENGWNAGEEIKSFIAKLEKEEKERTVDFDMSKLEKEGIDTGIKAINPANGIEVPIYIANYILSDYGTGAIMAVPAHDERDFEFAKKYNLEIKNVIELSSNFIYQKISDYQNKNDEELKNEFIKIQKDFDNNLFIFEEKGVLINSEQFSGLESDEAIKQITEKVGGKIVSKYKLKDWVFARQRYWGEPFPIVFDQDQSKENLSENEIISFGEKKDVAVRRDRVGLIVEKNGKVLCEKMVDKSQPWNFNGDYILIGGGIEKEESQEEAIKRELKEEIGVEEYKVISKVGEYFSSWFSNAQKRDREMLHHVYIISINQDLNINQEEIDDAVWIDIDEAIKDFEENQKEDQAFALKKLFRPESLKSKSYAVADKELPVILPNVENYEPTDNGESPLANIKDWVEVYGFINEEGEFESVENENVKIEGKEIKKFYRETNTMPQWAGSSWYYLRYIDPKNDEAFVNKELEKIWNPVDFYVGGAEHATRHLIYARFWHKFLFDKGFVSYDEPFSKLQTVGLIMAEDGKKMSKRYGNVVNPDDVVKEFGADAMRSYEMFMGPFEKAIAWNTNSISGVSRFLERVYNLVEKVELKEDVNDSKEIERIINETIKKVGEDIEGFKFNTAISKMMICLNSFEEETKKGNKISRNTFSKFIQILSPFAVHICEEVWQNVLENNFSIHTSDWPEYNEEKIKKDEIEMSLQISGKMRGTFSIKPDLEEEEIKELIKDLDIYKKYILNESDIKKIIVVKNRLINIVI